MSVMPQGHTFCHLLLVVPHRAAVSSSRLLYHHRSLHLSGSREAQRDSNKASAEGEETQHDGPVMGDHQVSEEILDSI